MIFNVKFIIFNIKINSKVNNCFSDSILQIFNFMVKLTTFKK